MLTYLLYALAVASLIQPSAPRLFAAVLFVAVISAHDLFMSDLTGLLYYGSAALFDLLILVLTSGINPVPRMVICLQRVCLTSIAINLLGWVLWLLYLPPTVYNAAFVCLYAWALLILVKRDGDNVGGYTMGGWASCFRFNRFAWSNYFNKNGGEI